MYPGDFATIDSKLGNAVEHEWRKGMLLARVLVTAEPPGGTHDCGQFGLVLNGELELEIGRETMRLTWGDACYVPAGVRHAIVKVISGPVEIVDVWPVSGPDVPEWDCCRLGCSRCT